MTKSKLAPEKEASCAALTRPTFEQMSDIINKMSFNYPINRRLKIEATLKKHHWGYTEFYNEQERRLLK